MTVYQTSFFRSIASSFYKCPHEFGKQFFLSHEYIVQPTSELPRNAYMHMDPYQALKFIIYLTDTTKENGAFRYVPNTVRLGRALREEFCKDDEGRRDAYRVDYHKFITYSDEDVKYCEAPAGSLIVFDTDLFHGGGLLEKPKDRKVLNFHCRKIEKPSLKEWIQYKIS